MADIKDQPTKKEKKPAKKKGPIRLEGILPAVILTGLLYAYFTLFFDSNLRKLIEFSATQIYGAEVNVSQVKTSFWSAFFEMKGLQVTDKEQPERNLVQIDVIRFDLLWDALLRAKFVVDEAKIENIQAYAPRKKPGKIIPPDTKESKALKEVEDGVVNQAKEQFNQNVLGDVANVIDGADPSAQLKNLQSNLKSDQKIKELEKALDEKKKIWDERLKSLPQKKEIDSLIARSKNLKFDSKNPVQFSKDLKELNNILKEGDKIVKDFDSASKDLKGDVGVFQGGLKGIDELAKNDFQDLQKRLQIPNLDVAEFSKGLFGKMISEKLGQYKKYMSLAREVMPEKKSSEEKAANEASKLVPKQRQAGRNFRFPITKGYPLFWLKKASISSSEGASEFSGNVKGKIQDLTNNPVQLGRPTTIEVQGDFPKQGIFGFSADIIVDHTTEAPYEKVNAKIEKFPVGKQKFSDSNDVKFALKKAVGQTIISGVSAENQINFSVNNQFTQPEYEIDAKSKTVKEILGNVINGIPTISVNAAATGSWSDINWKITSNLGRELNKGFKGELDKKLAVAKKQLHDFVYGRIESEKKKLTQQFDQVKGGLDAKINKQKSELEAAKNQAKNQLDQKKKSGTSQATKNEAKKAEKKLKKLLGL